jgi:hypothetical protein
MTFRKITTLSLRVVETIEVDLGDDDKPSLPPMPVVETTGTTVSETIRPLAKVIPLAAARRGAA